MQTDNQPRKLQPAPGESSRSLLSEVTPDNNLDLGCGLVSRLLRKSYGDIDDLQIQNFISFEPLVDQLIASKPASRLLSDDHDRSRTLDKFFPPLQDTLDLADVAFNKCYRIRVIINQDDFHEAVQKLYDTTQHDTTFPYVDWFSLVAALLAFAYAFSGQRHSDTGCWNSMAQSLAYLEFAEMNLGVAEGGLVSMTQLRSIVLIMFFKLLVKNPKAAYKHLALACEATIRLGLYNRYLLNATVKDDATTSTRNLFWITLYLDMYICALLNYRPYLATSRLDLATLTVMQEAARNVAHVVRSTHDALSTVGLTLQIELLKIAKSISKLEPYDQFSPHRKPGGRIFAEVNRLKKELDDFKVIIDAIFPVGEVVTVVARERFELLMSYCMAQILLSSYCDSLFPTTEVRAPSVPALQTQYDQLKFSAAIDAVDETIRYVQLPDSSPFSEPSVYTLFVSVICLTVAMLETSDMSLSTLLAAKIQTAYLLMTHVACPMHAATLVYLHDILKLGTRCGALTPSDEMVTTRSTASVMPSFSMQSSLQLDGWPLQVPLSDLVDTRNDWPTLPVLQHLTKMPDSTSIVSFEQLLSFQQDQSYIGSTLGTI